MITSYRGIARGAAIGFAAGVVINVLLYKLDPPPKIIDCPQARMDVLEAAKHGRFGPYGGELQKQCQVDTVVKQWQSVQTTAPESSYFFDVICEFQGDGTDHCPHPLVPTQRKRRR